LAALDVREQLRQNIDVQFAADASTYVMTDTTTNTNIASGTFTAGGTIEHNGWTVSFDGVIQANDKFSVRGNSAQAGDNRNLLKIIELQGNKDIFSGRGDFTEVYTDVIGDLGYSVIQAAVSRDAQQIIFDQAQAKRDETSAVSLDEEAANLLRFQQAYQASAQVISTASKLFDTILGIR
jgi:flagellar hook-associated protein 1 FlgK